MFNAREIKLINFFSGGRSTSSHRLSKSSWGTHEQNIDGFLQNKFKVSLQNNWQW